MAETEKTIFISHSTKDEAAVSAVCQAFDQADLPYWVSSRDIPDGANWPKSIISGLNRCQALVLIYSARSNASPHVKRELERALSRGQPIITFWIEDTPMSQDVEYFTSNRQWIKASNPPKDGELEDLVRAVRRVLKPGEGAGDPIGPVQGKKRFNRWWGLAAALLIIALGFYASQRFLGEDPEEATVAGSQTGSEIDSLILTGSDSLALAMGAAENPTAEVTSPRDLPPDYGLITFTSQPTGAKVILDGTNIGITPLRDYPVVGGSWEAHFVKNGYQRFSRSFSVNNGDRSAVDATLTRLPASLAVRTRPDKASLLLDGRLISTAPYTFTNLKMGAHTVQVSLPGYVTHTDTVEVWYGEEKEHVVTLQELRGTVTVEVIPSGRVFVDGSLKPNKTNDPLQISLPPGSYTIEARSPLYGSWFKTLEIVGQGSRDLVFDFSKEYTCKVLSEPSNAAIWVNGRFTEKNTPAQLRLRPGKRTIQVQKDGYLSPGPKELTVDADIEVPVRFNLSKSSR